MMIRNTDVVPRRDIDLLVFDWDGTLMDSTAAIAHAMQAGFREVGLTVPSTRDCNYVIGYGLKEAMQYLAPDLEPASVARLVDAYKHHFFSGEQKLALFDGVIEALPKLNDAGYLLAIATGKARQGLTRMLALTGIGEHFVVSRCADEAFSKPHPAMLEYILDFTGTDPKRALMIGDTTHDLELARNAGTHSAALSYGAHPIETMLPLQPLAHFDDFPSLAGWLLEEPQHE